VVNMKKINKRTKYSLIIIGLIVIAAVSALVYFISSSSTFRSNCIESQNTSICSSEYEGLTLESASQKAQQAQLVVKIRSIDGDTNIANTDLGGTLIYFTVENNIVTKAAFY
jgi:flagellar basal body-associated protein FliL